MADHFFSTNKGAGLAKDVTVGTSTAAGSCELRITDGAFTNKTDIIKCLEAIEAQIIQSTVIPA